MDTILTFKHPDLFLDLKEQILLFILIVEISGVTVEEDEAEVAGFRRDAATA
ncbi:hypothetical protein RND71_039595 [Anisodus tanguticus]|uniref:Uncharacterized protein n=1 Tax=Anisodus tanguticus TaxID=243964 RepID=A0AAE1UXR2_9SOLA|nr:hypothetical protein RND71_039595 [Anisodus tanguticus]